MKIFFDLDETLVHTDLNEPWPDDEGFSFTLPSDPRYFHCKPRPGVDKMLGGLMLHELFILTNAERDYAELIIRETGWPFEPCNIYTREDIVNNRQVPDGDKILVDNLFWRNNIAKLEYLGINQADYLQIASYYGQDNEDFISSVATFVALQSIDE